ncbi:MULTISPECIES: PIN/TRAM domain-containing protein [unclassified Gemella]|uniref:PIN/TRAM domain-containing protein n=1 Tax=unclassified Gemella TaxID=2624949 RepID=UPI001073E938|nr:MULTISPECIES: PIN domain-containing protein [unclassified Gemella]MBF0710112.1 TRAM domain-containing protein [Gemella sp. GL1.1]MBF0746191.1 TRAM domain-containing protein [Gemella sp. 19428wG2_WT2a]NYS27456.1 TRAM domain-containing protein [Gemella sp. GL1]TFU60476.1 TRAM domain-containing protein [Gemella sp. WT2a]
MLKKILIITSGLIGVTIGTILANYLITNNVFSNLLNPTLLRLFVTVFIAILFVIIALLLSDKFVKGIYKVEEKLSKIPIFKVISTSIGLILGLLVATLLTFATDAILSLEWLSSIISALFYIVFGYLGFVIGYRRGNETLNIFSNKLGNLKTDSENKKIKKIKTKSKLLDSSALIDSRIGDIVETGFIEGEVIVPEFVLKELQLIADSEDPAKRAKGRLGLECVEILKNSEHAELIIDNKFKYKEFSSVDDLLIEYALKKSSTIITTDYNLNKLATLQNIKVLNVNDLSNAVKPILSSGERVEVFIQREGKENNQGVAYSQDGTMIVVENGKNFVGKNVKVEVKSVLQTSSGRIIFTKII